jgi:hypothetical protein
LYAEDVPEPEVVTEVDLLDRRLNYVLCLVTDV